MLNQVDDVLVDQAAEDHLYHIHGFLIGDAHALNKFGFLAQPFQQTADLWTPAVDDDRVEPHLFEHHYITGETVFQFVVLHGVAAILDHHRGAGKALNVGQRLDQNPGGIVGTVGVHYVSLGSSVSRELKV